MPLMSCWTKTSMRRPSAPNGAPLYCPGACHPADSTEERPRLILNRFAPSGNGAAAADHSRLVGCAWRCYPAGMELNTELVIRVSAALCVFLALALWEVIAPRRATLI